jgi:hypothetical protein
MIASLQPICSTLACLIVDRTISTGMSRILWTMEKRHAKEVTMHPLPVATWLIPKCFWFCSSQINMVMTHQAVYRQERAALRFSFLLTFNPEMSLSSSFSRPKPKPRVAMALGATVIGCGCPHVTYVPAMTRPHGADIMACIMVCLDH